MKPDPKVVVGKCAHCGGPRKRPQKAYATPAQFERDPFCSRKCCEEWHAVEHKKCRCPDCGEPLDDSSAMRCNACHISARPAVEHSHGTVRRYRRGCRCKPCRLASNATKKAWRNANLERQRKYERERKRRVYAARKSALAGAARSSSPHVGRPAIENGEGSTSPKRKKAA